MTSNRRAKKLIRNHMESTGLCYLEAKRVLEGSGAIELAPLSADPRLGQIIAVASSRGGVGKTSLSIGIASYLAQASEVTVAQGLVNRNGRSADRPLKVLLIDLDLRDGQLGAMTGFWKPTVMKIRRFGINQEQIEETPIYDETLKIDLLLAPRRPRSADELPPRFYEELIDALRPLYDYIILDTSVNYLDPLFEDVVYPKADLILLATDPFANVSMAKWIAEVTETELRGGMGISKGKIQVIPNKTFKDEHIRMVHEISHGLSVVAPVPLRPKVFANALSNGEMVALFEDGQLREAFAEIASSIVGDRYPLAKLPDPKAK